MKRKIFALLLLLTLALSSCKGGGDNSGNTPPPDGNDNVVEEIKNDESAYGESIESLGAYDGYFEGDANDVKINCVSGTPGCYKVENGVITFTAIKAESIYSISGKFSGSIVINTGDNYKFELELSGFSLVSNSTNPITVISGDEVTIQAKKDTKNYIYDNRPVISESDTTSRSGAIHSDVDMEISGKGELWVVSKNNNGIHSKKDLQVKNLRLGVSCTDNALKGNDSVSLENARATLIATAGDGIKTTRTDISDKGNQRGSITFDGGYYNVYSAADGVDASYNVVVNASTTLSIFTDKYSNHSVEISAADKSTKGIKSGNEIVINAGDIRIKSYDNAIHASDDIALENNQTPLGNLTLNGGNLTVFTHGEGLRADNNLAIKGGNINILYSFCGIKGNGIGISGGTLGVISSFDGIVADSLSFDGGKTFVLSTISGNSAIRTKEKYTYTSGSVVALMHDGTATTAAKNCKNFASVGSFTTLSLANGECIVCTIGDERLTVNLSQDMSCAVVMLDSNSASATKCENSKQLAQGQFAWE